MPTPLPLEDNFNDVLAKAMRGRRVAPTALAAQAGVAPAVVKGLLDGTLDEPALLAVAPWLELGAEQLLALARQTYAPVVAAPDGLLCFSTPFDDFHVNAYVAYDPATRQAVVFDTGSNGAGLLAAVAAHGLKVELILLTHIHNDHIMALGEIAAATGAPAHISVLETVAGAQAFEEGAVFTLGCLRIEARRTWGHTRGGHSFYVTGLAVPLVVVGDALFAGSMGGGIVSYPDALATNRSQLFSLPAETVVCPGHGPLTTIALEKRHNPFYPEQKA